MVSGTLCFAFYPLVITDQHISITAAQQAVSTAVFTAAAKIARFRPHARRPN